MGLNIFRKARALNLVSGYNIRLWWARLGFSFSTTEKIVQFVLKTVLFDGEI